jgi:hypothetical protein
MAVLRQDIVNLVIPSRPVGASLQGVINFDARIPDRAFECGMG